MSNPFNASVSDVHKVDADAGGTSFQIDEQTANPFDQNSTPGHSRDPSQVPPNNPFNSYDDNKAAASPSDLNEWKVSLDKREEALNRKMRDLDKRGTALKRSLNNWPFPFLALTYHSINDEVEQKHRPMVKRYYYLWIWGVAAISWNWIMSIGAWVNVQMEGGPSGLTGFFLASIYLIAHVMLSWTLWYRSIYRACSNEKTKRWIFFFINFAMYLGWSVFLAIGIRSTGAFAFVFGLDASSSGFGTWGGLGFLTFGMWLVTILVGLYLLKQTHREYRSLGAAAKE